MQIIELTQNKVAFIDDEDAELIAQHKWCAHWNYSRWYAVSRISGKVTKMHKFLMGDQAVLDIDHIDGNGLNNQRGNLRWVTRAENLRNRRANYSSTSQYVGVYFERFTNKWCAAIKIDGRTYKIGRFENEYDAAMARDLVALDAWGNIAKMNVLEVPK